MSETGPGKHRVLSISRSHAGVIIGELYGRGGCFQLLAGCEKVIRQRLAYNARIERIPRVARK